MKPFIEESVLIKESTINTAIGTSNIVGTVEYTVVATNNITNITIPNIKTDDNAVDINATVETETTDVTLDDIRE